MNIPLIIERSFNADRQAIWKAITDKDEMKKWYFDLPEFKAEEGFKFEFAGGGKSGREEYIHLCQITEVIPGRKLSHTWNYQGYPGTSKVTFELMDDNGKTKVRLTHEGLESFSESGNADLQRSNFEEGWNMIIGTNLEKYLSENNK
jgi:uncharacterized protein YndB with AHSA1/START domain